MTFRFIGRSLPRTEDARLIQGLGRYTADLTPAGHCRLVVLRSPHAHARIRAINASAARAMPGVLLVLTGERPELAELGTFSSRVRRRAPDGSPSFEPPYRVVTRDATKFAGDVVAGVFAETLEQAKDAAEAIVVDWEPLPAVTQTKSATEQGVAQVWPEAANNICFVHDVGDEARVSAAFAQAAHRVSVTFDVNRVVAAPMEVRAALATYENDRWTLVAPLQNPHAVREELASRVLKVPGNRVRVVSPDVGGGFGLKETATPESVLALLGAQLLRRPVVWMGDRAEAFLGDYHARDNHTTAELALDPDGVFLALRVDTTANLGAYLSLNTVHTPTNNLGGLSGVYRTPAIFARVTGVFTNTPPTAPYRGAGRPEATYAIERAIDVAAQRCGFDRVELRRRNMIAPGDMPYRTGFVFTYDSGEFERNMDEAIALARFAEFPARRKDAATRGKLAGIGLSNPIEISAGPITGTLSESAALSFDATGSVTVTLGTHSHGQGHEITFAQIVSDVLGLEPEQVRVRYGDTDFIEHGTGTFGSRSVVAGSVSLIKASDKLIERGKLIAASHFEAAHGDVEFDTGTFRVAGTDRRITLPDVARLSFTMRPEQIGGELGLSAQAIAAPDRATFPNGCHICEVEIDPDTGVCTIIGYTVVDDVGRIINPTLVEGQIHGGIVQGLGQVFGEDIAYDAEGQLLSGSFMDYAMPRAHEFPNFVCENREVLTPTNPLGVKGAGEAGTVGALAAAVNAVVDALAPLGIDHIDMPLTPPRLWRAISGAQTRAAP